MSKMEIIPKGTLLAISTGEYSDHIIWGMFYTLEDIDPEALREDWLKKNPKQSRKYNFEYVSFITSIQHTLKPINHTEWNLCSYSSIDEMYIDENSMYQFKEKGV